jgi:GTP-binding protein HflX
MQPDELISNELVRSLTAFSFNINRTISILINRRGKVFKVVIGDTNEIEFEKLLGRFREAKSRLRRFRLFHTHLKDSALSKNDLTTLIKERLDLIGVVEVLAEGFAGKLQIAHITPVNKNSDKKWELYSYNDVGRVDLDWNSLIAETESKLQKSYTELGGEPDLEGVLLVGFHNSYKSEAEKSVGELKSLALSAGKKVLDTVIQVRREIDPRYLIGKGKLKDVILQAEHIGAGTIIFDVELTPAQVNAIIKETTLNIIDKTELILEIFEKHAVTSEGKLQVRLAELIYCLPRLRGKGIEYSQLGGGIGTRGPGEKKIEYQRRTIRKQIDNLEKQIDNICFRRKNTREKRTATGIPVVSLLGYTNVGKSTLFNSLTKDNVKVQNKLFSTLSPTTRRIKLPSTKDILITDTVGFISGLPEELINAFRATLEELGEADLLLHVADASDPSVEEKIESVDKIISSMGFEDIPKLLVFNKRDNTNNETLNILEQSYETTVISALNKTNIKFIREIIDFEIQKIFQFTDEELNYQYTA